MPNEREDTTRAMFESYNYFKKEITQIYRDIDPAWNAEQSIMALWQITSVATYAVEF